MSTTLYRRDTTTNGLTNLVTPLGTYPVVRDLSPTSGGVNPSFRYWSFNNWGSGVIGPDPFGALNDTISQDSRIYVSPPIASGFTMSGAITGRAWAGEYDGARNIGWRFYVYRLQPGGTLTQVVMSGASAELPNLISPPQSPDYVQVSATPPSGVAFSPGDRIVFVPRIAPNVGGSSGNRTIGGVLGGHFAGADDLTGTYVIFSEDITFGEPIASGSQPYVMICG